ncbi:MAG: hypothetical protein HW408_552 [Actinobacteria bacterium]|nr:hypothetical protein [Actinomycetota bacterium]
MAPFPSATSFRSSSSGSLGTEKRRRGGVIPAVFLLSAAMLADEIFLIRLLSFRFWPHFVPMIVSQAMLGFGAAGVAMHLFRTRVGKAPRKVFTWLILLAAPSFDLAFRASQKVAFDPFLLLWDPSAWPAFALFFLLLAIPFFLAGGAIAVPFAFRMGSPGPIYAASFAGSAAGAVLALAALSLVPTGSLLRLPVGLGIAAGAFIAWDPVRRPGTARLAVWAASLLLIFAPPDVLRLSPYKDLAMARKLPEARELSSRFGPSGDFRAVKAPGIHSAPGLSFRFDGDIPPQAALFGDGEARGIVPLVEGNSPPAYLDYFPMALAYRLSSRPSVLQFGLRGTEGILAAYGNGAASDTVIEPAKELVTLVTEDLGVLTGGLSAFPGLEIRTEAGRNYLAREKRRFDLIEVPEISSATFSSVGIHATGETFLLTGEGIRSMLSRLSDRGIISFSGWLKSPPRESVKILATLKEEMERIGGPAVKERVIMARGWGSFVILARMIPFDAEEHRRSQRFCDEMGFSVVWPHTGGIGASGPEDDSLRKAVANVLAGSSGDLAGGLFDLSPVTDDSPYFHKFLLISSLPDLRRLLGTQWVPFVEWGVVFLLLSLAISVVLAAVFLLLPLAFARLGENAGGIRFAAYFSALGLAYMLVEMTYLKIGILLFGDPIRAATAAIGGFAFFSGMGSIVSGSFESPRTMGRRICPAIAFLALAGFLSLFFSLKFLLAAGDTARTAIFLAALAPAAVMMGVPFPAAMSRLSSAAPSSIPFAWGINGFFSVAGASLASVGALWMGFCGTVAAGSVFYLLSGALYSAVGKTCGSWDTGAEQGSR